MSGKDKGTRYLVVRGESTSLRLALPALGSLSIGEAIGSDVRITEGGIAPEHAALFLDHGIGLKAIDGETALRSRETKGRAKKEQPLDNGQTAELEIGDRLRLGSVEISFAESAAESTAGSAAESTAGSAAERAAAEGGRRVFSRAYLERRLAEQFVEGAQPALSVVRLAAEGGPSSEALERAIFEPLRPSDLVADLGGGEYAVLLLEVTEAHARSLVAALAQQLGAAGVELSIGCAGRSDAAPGELLEAARERMARPHGAGGARRPALIAVDPEMHKAMAVIERVAKSSAHVLILGETGTGKDLVAQMIHDLSDRSNGPFVRLSCVDLPEAPGEKPAAAILARARGGTVHLDEVGGFSPRAQLSLGYMLEEAGAGGEVRFVASSNQDLAANVAEGTFRKDLFFRLNKLSVTVPPLRQRSGDIVPLAELFIAEAAEAAGRGGAPPELSQAAQDRLASYTWPGNVRELRNVIERALLHCTEATLGLEHLPPEVLGGGDASTAAVASTAAGEAAEEARPGNLRDEIAALEKRRILEALRRYPTQREAAESLNMPMRTFLNRLDALGIPRARGGGGQKE